MSKLSSCDVKKKKTLVDVERCTPSYRIRWQTSFSSFAKMITGHMGDPRSDWARVPKTEFEGSCMKPKGLALRGKFWQHWWLEHLRVPILTRTRNVFGELFRRTYFVSFFSPQVKELSCIKSCPTPRFIRNIIFQAPKLPFFLPW